MADLKITELTGYTPPIDTDVMPIVDITTSATKKVTWANIKATLKTYFDSLYATLLGIHEVSPEGLVLGMNFNTETLTGTAGSETVLDSSNYNNHGTNSGATATSTQGFNGGGAFSFDGTNNYIDIPSNTVLNALNDKQTWSFWFKANNLAGVNEAMLSSRVSGAFMYVSQDSVNNKLKVRINDGTHDAGMSGISISNILDWNYITLTVNGFNSTGAIIYVNGEFYSYIDISTITSLTNTNGIEIGRQGAVYFNGLIDNVQIYKRALSADEIKAQYLQRAEVRDALVNKKNAYINNATILSSNYAVDAEASDTYAITLDPAPVNLSAGMVVVFKANTVNTGAATLNVNGLGAKAIVKGVSTALADNDILAGMICQCAYDGTSFVLLNPRVL